MLTEPPAARLSPAAWLGLIFAMTFPTAAAAVYFLILETDGQPSRAQQLSYTAGKFIQFTFPLLFVFLADRRWPQPRRPRFEGLMPGAAFGLIVAATMLFLYVHWLANVPMMAGTPKLVQSKLIGFGVTSFPEYLAFAVFVVVVHSLLEEYYWRWFLFGRLCDGLRPVAAALVSSLAFMSHHVVILYVYFPGYWQSAVVPFALGVAAGGLVWAWLFHRTGSIYAPWLSHLLVDAALFIIGWDLVRRAGGG